MVSTHSRPQRPRSFWSAPKIVTSGRVGRVGRVRLFEHALRIRFVISANQICQTWLWTCVEWREVSESWTSGVGPSQRSRFLVLAKRSVASGDDIGLNRRLHVEDVKRKCHVVVKVAELEDYLFYEKCALWVFKLLLLRAITAWKEPIKLLSFAIALNWLGFLLFRVVVLNSSVRFGKYKIDLNSVRPSQRRDSYQDKKGGKTTT